MEIEMNALIIANNSDVSNLFEQAFLSEKIRGVIRQTAGEAIEELVKRETDLCVIDWRMIDSLHSDLVEILQNTIRATVPYLIVTLPNEDAIPAVMDFRADDFLINPIRKEECVGRIRIAINRIKGKRLLSTGERKVGVEDMYRRVMDAMREGLMVIDAHGIITIANESALKTIGMDEKDILGAYYYRIPVKMLMEDGAEITRENNPLRQSLIKGETIRDFNLKIHPPAGMSLWISFNSSPLYREGGNAPFAVVITFSDITERKERERRIERQFKRVERTCALLNDQKTQLKTAISRLEELVDTDGLTGVKNYRAFRERLTHEYDRAMRYGGGLSLVMIDVDHFKRFNDTYGHPEGDEVLKRVASMLQNSLRSTDMVARYGGEEFVILLPNTDRIGAVTMAERFRKELQNAEWERSPITASFGVSTLTPATPDKEIIVDEADKALYFAKQSGRNCVKHYWDMTDANPLVTWDTYSYDE